MYYATLHSISPDMSIGTSDQEPWKMLKVKCRRHLATHFITVLCTYQGANGQKVSKVHVWLRFGHSPPINWRENRMLLSQS